MPINSQTTSQSHVDYSIDRPYNIKSINTSNTYIVYEVDRPYDIHSMNRSKSKVDNFSEVRKVVASNTKSTSVVDYNRIIRDSGQSHTYSNSKIFHINRKNGSALSGTTSMSQVGTDVFAIVCNSHDIIKDALKYNLGNLNPIPTTVDTYIHDNFIFKFPLFNKRSLTIYIYDDRYDFNKDFDNAALKVYENGKWIHEDIWVGQIEQYLFDLYVDIETNKERLEAERELEEYNRQREENEKLIRFAILLGAATSKGIILPHWIDADKSYDVDYEFDGNSTLADFMEFMFDADVVDVNTDE